MDKQTKIKVLSKKYTDELQKEFEELEEKNNVKVVSSHYNSYHDTNVVIIEVTPIENPFDENEKHDGSLWGGATSTSG